MLTLYRFTTVLVSTKVFGMLIIDRGRLGSFCKSKMETIIYDCCGPNPSAKYVIAKSDFEAVTDNPTVIAELQNNSQRAFNDQGVWIVCGITPFGVYT